MSGDAGRLPARGEGHGGPARGYSWEPFEEGNTAALVHGAYSPAIVDPVAEELLEAVLAEAATAHLAAPQYAPALAAWARAEARIIVLERWLAENADQAGVLDAEGELLPAVKLLERVERRAESLRSRLGLDPRSEADLTRSRADAGRSIADLDALRRRGREVLEARFRDDDGGDDAA